MNILILGSSSDSGRDPAGNLNNQILCDMLEREFGEPFTLTSTEIWPNARMPEYAARLIRETNPGIIYFNVTDYPVAYPSTAVRLRRFGAPGRRIARGTLTISSNRDLTHNRPIRALRTLLQATIGGDTHVPIEDAIDRYTQTLRIAARQENSFVAVRGPAGEQRKGVTKRQRRASEAKRFQFHRALRDTCATLHIPYFGSETPAWADPSHPDHFTATQLAGDATHLSEEGAHLSATRHFNRLSAAYRAYLAAAHR